MIDFFKELAWAIAHDADTKIILSIFLSMASVIVSVAAIILKVTGR